MHKPDEQEETVDDERHVQRQLEDVRRFVGTLQVEDYKSGAWFEKLLRHAFATYTKKVDANYFRERYPDIPADAVVQARIEMAAKYAGIEGGITSAAYTTAVAATIGSGGGASPLTLPAGGAAFAVDLVYLSQLQIKLAYDISVLYQVPLDLEDPDDLWKLIRIAFSVKIGEGAGLATVKGIPAVVRPLVKKYFSKGVLASAKALPVVGKYLLQRNVIKFAIPAVSVPATVAVNYWTTKITGQQAQDSMRTEAKLIEAASRIADHNPNLTALLWAMWLTISSDGMTTEEQRTLLHGVTVKARERGVPEADLTELRNVIDIDRQETWERLSAVADLSPIYSASIVAASVNGRPSKNAVIILEKMARQGAIEFRKQDIDDVAREWANHSKNARKKHPRARTEHSDPRWKRARSASAQGGREGNEDEGLHASDRDTRG